MKSDILIFRSKVPVARRSTAYRLEKGLKAIGIDNYEEVYYSDIVIRLDQNNVQAFRKLDSRLESIQADLAYLHGFSAPDIRQFMAMYLHQKQIKFINSENLHNMPTSKLNQYYSFSQNNVPYPPTIAACPPNFSIAMAVSGYDYPVVVKGINSKRGFDNYLVKGETELLAHSAKLDPLQPFVIQPFIPNDGDYRFIVFENSIVACYKKSRPKDSTDHRNNVSQGGKRVIVDNPPAQAAKAAITAAKILKRELTGIDIVIDADGQAYVLESNFNFGLKDENDGIYELVLEKLAPIMHELATR